MSIIVAFSKIENAKKIKSILQKSGFDVVLVCSKGSMVIDMLNKLDSAILVCGLKLLDMHYSELIDYVPEQFKVVLLGLAASIENDESQINRANIIPVKMPLKTQEFIDTITDIENELEKKFRKKANKSKSRSEEDKKIINEAKQLLMDKNGLTEAEARDRKSVV